MGLQDPVQNVRTCSWVCRSIAGHFSQSVWKTFFEGFFEECDEEYDEEYASDFRP